MLNHNIEWKFVLEQAPIMRNSKDRIKRELHFLLQCILNKKELSTSEQIIYLKTKQEYLKRKNYGTME